MIDDACGFPGGRMAAETRRNGSGSVGRHVLAKPTPGFTLIELLVVIAILSLLVTILMPSLNRAKFLAKNVICLSNQHQIAMALVTYTSDFRDTIIFADESPYKGVYNGNRQAPRILADADLLAISNEQGGVWRCPLDETGWKPWFLSYYWYYEGGPGSSDWRDNPLEEYGCSYSNNAVYRFWSERSPWSYWGPSGEWVPRFYSAAARPTNTIWFYDSCWGWKANGNTPYQMFYEVGVLEFDWHWDGGLYRHNPDNQTPYGSDSSGGPFGNVAFMDGHVRNGLAYLDTCTDEDYNYDADLAYEWWSFTGE